MTRHEGRVAALSLGTFHPGRSWLHRTPARAKLVALMLLGVGLVIVPAPFAWVVGSSALALVVLVGVSARLPLHLAARALRAALLLAALAAAYQWWRSGWQVAVGVLTTVVALILAGVIVTMTTPMDALVDEVVQAARPLRRVGVRPEWVGLGVALTLRGVPAIIQVGVESRDAARARGLERNPRALLVPTAVRTVARARRMGEALAARGLAD